MRVQARRAEATVQMLNWVRRASLRCLPVAVPAALILRDRSLAGTDANPYAAIANEDEEGFVPSYVRRG